MAVSNQWFLQWSTPDIQFADVTRNFNHVRQDYNYNHNYNPYYSFVKSNQFCWLVPLPGGQNSGFILKKQTINDRTRVAGVSLWLTMLGLRTMASLPVDNETPPFSTLYKWKYVDFDFPSERHRQRSISNGDYIPENCLPLGLEVWGNRMFVSLPSWRRGIPATLTTVSRTGGNSSPLLKPYPDWSYHRAYDKGKNCTGLTSVFRMNVDSCGRLWVLDAGQIDSQDSPKQICPPSLVVFNLEKDIPIARYVIPKKYVLEDSLFSNIIVDTRLQDCSDLYVYIADTWRFGLIVFRESDQMFWRFNHHFFFPDPLASNFTLHGLNFQWTDGILGLALSPIHTYGDRKLYFHPMSSYREFYVQTSVLRDPSRVNSSASEFRLLEESRGPFGHSSASAIDRNGIMFYGLVTRDSVGCWDTRKPYIKSYLGIVAKNAETLIFPNDIRISQEERQTIFVITNRLPMYQDGPLDPEDYNYRIMFADTLDAVHGTMIFKSFLLITSFGLINTYSTCDQRKAIGTLYRWKQIDYNYPSLGLRQQAIQNGDFNQINVIPLGVERWKNRVFVSTPRWKKGVPATLSSIPVEAVEESPPLRPYPSWDWHTAENCTGFTSVFRMSIDHCGVMWVLDSGQVEAFETPRQICPPTLFAISLDTDTVLARYTIPSEFVLQNSLITNLIVDSRDAQCRDLHVYIADAWRFGLIVFRDADASFWRFSHYSFYPEPLLSNYTLHGLNYQWSDGIFGMSLGSYHLGDRDLYYHAMSSSLEFVVKTSVIRDPSRVNNAVGEFKLLGDSRGMKGQVSAAAVDRNGIMFFSLISLDSIGCWDTRKDYKLDNLDIVAQNNNTLVFPNDLRLDHEVPQVAWIITNRLPQYQFNLIDPNEYNYRVMYLDPNLAIENSVCKPV
ncbi:yellow-h3 [Danaus plexippus plexippus]|uniref:Yellow-h3 n=1 Tax=Danaus plexippus plexippus TaxID=278856 RepID=A0A212ET54_DANPL|nr:yellow-h3 [Danaus plexippus plexippus]